MTVFRLNKLVRLLAGRLLAGKDTWLRQMLAMQLPMLCPLNPKYKYDTYSDTPQRRATI